MRFILQYPEASGTELDLLDAGAITEVASSRGSRRLGRPSP